MDGSEESGRPEKAKIVNKDLKAIHDYDILSYMREHISLASDIDPEDFFGTSLGQQPSCDKTISGDRGLLEPRILAISDSVDLGSTSSPQSSKSRNLEQDARLTKRQLRNQHTRIALSLTLKYLPPNNALSNETAAAVLQAALPALQQFQTKPQ